MEKHEVIAEFWDGFVAGDEARLATVVDDKTSWYISGRSLFAGQHRGLDGVLALRAQLEQIGKGTFRGGHADPAAAHHAYLLDLVTVERDREQRSVYITLVADVQGGRLGLTWLYFEDQYAFDAAFS